MTWIPKTNRREAYKAIKPDTPRRQGMILYLLDQHPDGLTAEDITDYLARAGAVKYYDLNFVRPRLTELAKAGKITAAGKVKSDRTGRNITLWQINNQKEA